MRTTTNHGWPVAEGTDPAKQYPAMVDGPFKDALDVQLKQMEDLWTRLGLSGYRVETVSKVVPTDAAKLAPITFVAAFASAPVVVLTHGSAGQVAGSLSLNALPTATSMLVNGGWTTSGLSVRINYVAIGPAVPVTALREGEQAAPFITYQIDPDPEP